MKVVFKYRDIYIANTREMSLVVSLKVNMVNGILKCIVLNHRDHCISRTVWIESKLLSQ